MLFIVRYKTGTILDCDEKLGVFRYGKEMGGSKTWTYQADVIAYFVV